MQPIDKTVFISYRRTNVPWALVIYKDLTHNEYDVFFDFTGIKGGDFESVILANIKARAHFVVLLTPSALKRCNEPGDWLRREIEMALDLKRNIVPLMLEGFSFKSRSIARQLTGKLALLSRYNALPVPIEYFDEAMKRLRDERLNVALDAVLHPPSVVAQQAALAEQAAVRAAPAITAQQLTAQEVYERGCDSIDLDEQLRLFSEAIRLQPDFAEALNNRGAVKATQGDLTGALEDFNESIRLLPDEATAFSNRGNVRKRQGDLKAAIKDYNKAIRIDPEYAAAFSNRGNAFNSMGDLKRAIKDYTKAVRLDPDYAAAFYNRGVVHQTEGNHDGAIKDYSEAIRLDPDYAKAWYNRARVHEEKGEFVAAIADYQKYLKVGGGERNADTEEVELIIRELKKNL
jgi:tetratricopeptide (TPR) repeat protein